MRVEPSGLTGIAGRWFPVPAAEVPVPPIPPLPPAVTRLSGPDQANPGETVQVSATVTDANGDSLTYRWSTTRPDGTTVSTNPVGEATAAWAAPLQAGTYLVGLTVDDPYFSTTACQPLPIVVPNLCPDAAITGTGGGTLPTQVMAGATVGFSGTATDGNGDAISWSWTTTGGTLSPTTGTAATWTAPATAGLYTITGTASDGACQDPASHQIVVIAPTPTPTPTPTPVPTAPPPGTIVKTWTLPYEADRIGVGPNGNAWVTHPSYDKVSQLNANGGVIGTWYSGSSPRDIAVSVYNHAWVTHTSGYVRYMSDATGATRQYLNCGGELADITVDPNGQTAYAAIRSTDSVAVLFGTNAVYSWRTVNDPTGIDLSEDMKVLTTVSGYGTQYIRKHQPGAFQNGQRIADYLTGAGPRDIKVDRVNHRIWVVCEDSNVASVLNANGQRVTPDFSWRTPAIYNHKDLAVDRAGNGYITLGALMRKYSPQGVLLQDFGPANGVTVDAQGFVWYTSGKKVYKMTP